MVLGFFNVWILLYLLIFFLLELLLYKNWTPNPSFTCFMLIFINSVTSFCFSRFSESSLNWFSIHQLFPHPPPGDSFLLFTTYDKFCFVLFFSAIMFFYCHKKVHGLRMLFLVSLFSFSLKNKLWLFRSFMFPILLLL